MEVKKIQAWEAFFNMRRYKEELPKLREEYERLEDEYGKAVEVYEADDLPESEWNDCEKAVEAAHKAYKDMGDRINATEHIIKLLTELSDELEFLEGC